MPPHVHVVIEESQAMPGQGSRSMFTIGYGYGIWLGLLPPSRFPYTSVRPAAWKRLSPGTKDKEASRLRAHAALPWGRPPAGSVTRTRWSLVAGTLRAEVAHSDTPPLCSVFRHMGIRRKYTASAGHQGAECPRKAPLTLRLGDSAAMQIPYRSYRKRFPRVMAAKEAYQAELVDTAYLQLWEAVERGEMWAIPVRAPDAGQGSRLLAKATKSLAKRWWSHSACENIRMREERLQAAHAEMAQKKAASCSERSNGHAADPADPED